MDHETKIPFILIVDDDRDVAAYFRHVLDLAGYRTEIVSNGKTVVDIIFKRLPDVVLLDLNLPGVSGAEILQLLKSDERLKKTHVIVVTGYSQMVSDLFVEPDLVLFKPVSPDQLTDLVMRLCQDDEAMEKHRFEKNPWDKITGLYNRSFFINRLSFAFANGKNDRENLFAVMLVSLDESIYTSLNAKKKEPRLREIAQIIKASVRPTDTIARFGSGNFFILIENIHNGGILSVIADRIQRALFNNPSGGTTFSIGAILCDNEYNFIDEILTDVNTALSLAKTDQKTRSRILTRGTLDKKMGRMV